jgi:hypothetical protein
MGTAGKIDLNTIQKIQQEERERSQLWTIAFHLTDVSGRLTNSPGYERASAYAMQQLKQMGDLPT